MHFHLVYRGLLPSAGNKSKPDHAAHIRKRLHPQLQELWRTHHILRRIKQTAIVRSGEAGGVLGVGDEGPFDVERDVVNYPARDDEIDLLAPVQSGAFRYRPLIRESMHLNCSLSITFLRHDNPLLGVTQNGDLDGRLKCLLDALTIPRPELADRYPTTFDPMYCLMENDSFVSSIEVNTGRLLLPGERHRHEVQLVIEVRINVLRVGPWNMAMLGS